jgi:hypothetical protein
VDAAVAEFSFCSASALTQDLSAAETIIQLTRLVLIDGAVAPRNRNFGPFLSQHTSDRHADPGRSVRNDRFLSLQLQVHDQSLLLDNGLWRTLTV